MGCNQHRRTEDCWKRRQGKNLGPNTSSKRQHAISPEPAILHNRKPRLARRPAHAIKKIGKAILVQSPGDRDARGNSEERRERSAPELRSRKKDGSANRADQSAGQRKI